MGTDYGGVKMLSPYRLQRLALASLVSSFTYIAITAATKSRASTEALTDFVEVALRMASVWICCHDGSSPHLAIRHTAKGLSSWLRRSADQ